ncbi:MAG: tRNA isopentenyl-2-thiomethyl-A-37 hydroxylase MiaE [Steroidobacteraceae bacterium]
MSAATPRHADPLRAPTPAAWVEAAAAGWQELLLDHANCEKKAASTALALMFAYPEQQRDNLAFARLAREELRHFEQVTRMMERLGVAHRRLRPGRYAAGLRAAMRTSEPGRRLDLLLIGALIEARSCERFRLLVPRLAEPLAGFYAELERSEARHIDLYLDCAAAASPGGEAQWRDRLAELAAVEAGLATAPDELLRFHSGPPRGSVSSA